MEGVAAEEAGPGELVDLEGAKVDGRGAWRPPEPAVGQGSPPPVQVRPGVVHFGGYELGKSHVQDLVVTNVSTGRLRTTVLGTTGDEFATEVRKRGVLAPGLSEVVRVKFVPGEWKYYTDEIRVSWGKGREDTVVVPVHAYPVVNKAHFPTKIDFGVCELNETHTRIAILRCEVPVSFDFEISVASSNSEFSVEPRKGVVPANGEVQIRITFTPRKLVVVNSSVCLHVSQFNFEPIVCALTGSAQPGLHRERLVSKYEKTFSREMDTHPDADARVKEIMNGPEFGSHGKPRCPAPRGTGAGAVHDPGASVLPKSNQEERETPKMKNNKKSKNQREAPGASDNEDDDVEDIGGIKVPKNLRGVHATNYVLTQEPGKLKPKELKKTIEKHREVQAREAKALEDTEKEAHGATSQSRRKARRRSAAAQLDPVDAVLQSDCQAADQSTTRQVKEMVFLQQLLEIEQEERSRVFASQARCIGDRPLAPEQVAAIREAREKALEEQALSRRRVARQAWTHEVMGPNSVPPMRAAAAAVGHHAGSSEVPAPSFDPYQNDLWRRRKLVLVQFQGIVGCIIVRQRARRRLAAIWKRLGGARTRKAVRELVEEDAAESRLATLSTSSKPPLTEAEMEEPAWKKYRRMIMAKPANRVKALSYEQRLAGLALDSAAGEGEGADEARAAESGSPGAGALAAAAAEPPQPGPVALALRAARTNPAEISASAVRAAALGDVSDLHLVSFPLYNDSTVIQAKPVPSDPIKGFQDMGFFRLRVPDEYKLCGYAPFPHPEVPKYMPKYDAVEMRKGAEHESVWRPAKPPKFLPGPAALPVHWAENEYKPRFGLVLQQLRARAFMRTDMYTEADPEYYLQPTVIQYVARPTRDNDEALEVGASTLRSLLKEPTISSRWRRSTSRYSDAYGELWDNESLFKYLLDGPREEDALSDDEASSIEGAEARKVPSASEDAAAAEKQVARLEQEALALIAGAADADADANVDANANVEADAGPGAGAGAGADVDADTSAGPGHGTPAQGPHFADAGAHVALLTAEIDSTRKERSDRLSKQLRECAEALDPALRYQVRALV